MSQHSSKESRIKPALQAALGSLDVEIDRELARFRREHKRAQPANIAGNNAINRLGQQPMELIAIAATGGRTQPDAPTTEAHPSRQIHLPGSAEGQQTPSALPGFDPFPAGPLALTSTPDPATSPATPDGNPSASDDLAVVGVPLASLDANPTEPENYLESSEQLLNSLSDPTQPRLSGLARRRQRRKNPLLTPLGVGSILLFLLASATVVYLALNPARFRSTLARLFNRSETATTPSNLPPVTVRSTPTTLPELPKAPNLATETFAEINLSTLATLNATPQPTPIASLPPAVPSVLPNVAIAPNVPTTVNPGEGLENLSTALLPQSSPPPQPTQTSSPNPTRSPSAAANQGNLPPVPNSSPAPGATTNQTLYFVVTNYNGDASLQQARQVVSDAYVRDFASGKRIQLGTFYTEDQAKVMIEQLKQQGISAQLYKP